MQLIDSHCHLDDKQFDPDREAVIERAFAAGVRLMLAVGTGNGPPDLEAAIGLAEAHQKIFATVGVHPHDASKAGPETYRRLEELLSHPKVLALGEIGLDYHYDLSPRETQREVFAAQLRLAGDKRKPVTIHTREAWEDTMKLLREYPPASGMRGIFHCFSGGPEELRQALDLGFYVSFAGVVTFPKALNIQEAARQTPLDRILVETDAPYLAPVPKRGKRNEPAFVVETARKVAELKGIPVEQLAEASSRNFERLLLPQARASE
jgi:TatD DNase family protein